MRYRYLIVWLFCSFLIINNLKAEKRTVNLLHKDYFSFEAGDRGWYFWNTNDYWNVVSEKASDGNFSMRFSYPDLSNVSYSVKAQVGSSQYEGSKFEIPAGTHEMKIKVWVEPGTTLSGFVFVIKQPWTTINWQIDTVTTGKWIELKKEIVLTEDVSSNWQLVVESSQTGGGTFFLDEFSIMGEIELPDHIPNKSVIRTAINQGVDLRKGNYVMRLKAKKEDELSVAGFYTAMPQINNALYWDLTNINGGTWVQLEQEFEVLEESNSNKLEIIVPNAVLLGGVQSNFYIDDLEIEYYPATTVGINKEEITRPRVYPNPSNGQFYCEHLKDVKSIIVSSLNGQTFFQQDVNSESLRINLSTIPPGLYVVGFNLNNGEKIAGKLIIH